MMGMGKMMMFFHVGLGDLLLFRNFVIDSQARLLLAAILLFLAALLLEAIDYTRAYLSCKCQSGGQRPALAGPGSASGPPSRNASHLLEGQPSSWPCCAGSGQQLRDDGKASAKAQASFLPALLSQSRARGRARLVQATLQFVRTGLSLSLMLAAMTYNICLITPIVFGKCPICCPRRL